MCLLTHVGWALEACAVKCCFSQLPQADRVNTPNPVTASMFLQQSPLPPLFPWSDGNSEREGTIPLYQTPTRDASFMPHWLCFLCLIFPFSSLPALPPPKTTQASPGVHNIYLLPSPCFPFSSTPHRFDGEFDTQAVMQQFSGRWRLTELSPYGVRSAVKTVPNWLWAGKWLRKEAGKMGGGYGEDAPLSLTSTNIKRPLKHLHVIH